MFLEKFLQVCDSKNVMYDVVNSIVNLIFPKMSFKHDFFTLLRKILTNIIKC